MTRDVLEKEILALLRTTALEGSQRPISFTEPLGEQGIGLDSLGLLQFVTSVENAYQIEIPEEFWLETGRLSLRDLTAWIATNDGKLESVATVATPTLRAHREATRWDGLVSAFRDRGWRGGVWWVSSRVWHRASRSFTHREKLYVLEFDFTRNPIPRFPSPFGVEFRDATFDDLPATEGLWLRRNRDRKRRLFQERLARGYKCHTAWYEGRIVAIDWAAITGDHEPKTGLQIKLNPGVCYGLDLDEHPQYRGQGLGLAILEYSLRQCKERGNHTQYTIVHADNQRMLRAAIQLFGFRQVGEVNTRRTLWHKSTTWRIDNRQGSDHVLEL